MLELTGSLKIFFLPLNIYKIQFINENTGFALTQEGIITKTDDGGNSWNIIYDDIYEIYDIEFISTSKGWSCGQFGLINVTTDGGSNWTQQYSSPSINITSLNLIDSNIVFAAGDKGSILYTINGGLVVPVELTSFIAKLFENKVKLIWSTASELNNHGFEVQRSLDKTSWATIGFKEGFGTTSVPQQYSFSDNITYQSSSKLYYRLKQIDYNGTYEYSDVIEVETAPVNFSLEQNYPNPFNPNTKISWQSPIGSWQTLKIYDVLGNEVATLVNEYRNAGSYEVEFKSTVGSHQLASGIYYYRLKAGDFVETKKMILLK